MIERWAIISNYETYAVSTLGRVRNLTTGQLLKHQSSKRRGHYAFVNLYKSGRRKNVNVHVIVARMFLGPCPIGMVVHHKDGNRMNPKLDNLEYLTHEDNQQPRNKRVNS